MLVAEAALPVLMTGTEICGLEATVAQEAVVVVPVAEGQLDLEADMADLDIIMEEMELGK